MDRIIKITLCGFIVILAGFVGIISYDGFLMERYHSSLSGSYAYSFSVTTDSELTNVTFFIPVPEDPSGNSPIVSRISAKDVSGLPADWQTALFATGKATMLKITTVSIRPPAGTTAGNPYTVTFRVNISSKNSIETLDPVTNGVIFRPVRNLRVVPCTEETSSPSGSPTCAEYITPVLADYSAAPGATVTLSSTLDGINNWKILEPQANEYHTEQSVLLFGENHGWTTEKGTLVTGMGSCDLPKPLI
ncbi:MAG: hypothetical protein LUP97_06835 [Methanoregula sp.]|nr:hypothetical protein [Methanoregula sp.]